ncbi:hypothetical protein [Maribacter sp. Asnod2-G09]|uniref:hypothetical protein n=1 Tax=Maribacter sp. Asnod2-G09 TaxID=3160577 RepID=UPI00386E728A
MKKLIYTYIFLMSFGFVKAQEIDSLIEKVAPEFCNCIEKIESYASSNDLGNQLKKCDDAYTLSKSDSLLIENVGSKEYESKIFKALRNNCCAFKDIFSEMFQKSIERNKITQIEIDSIKTKPLIGNSLSDNRKHFNSISEAIKIKVTDIKKDSCGYPTHIYASSNGVTFRISTLFDDELILTDDDYLLIGKIQDAADGLYITDNDLKDPYFFVFTVINLKTLEMRKMK